MPFNLKYIISVATLTCLISACGSGGSSSKETPQTPSTPVTPNISIADVTITEGNEGTAEAVFTVTLSQSTSNIVTVDYATSDDTAIADEDYVAVSGTLTFEANTTSQQVSVAVNGDIEYADFDSDEVFFLNLTNATNANISRNRATGIIANDDITKLESYEQLKIAYKEYFQSLPNGPLDTIIPLDLDNDSDEDLLMLSARIDIHEENNIVIYRNELGNGFKREITEFKVGTRGDHIVADFNNDGLKDFYWSDSGFDDYGVKIYGAQERLFLQQIDGSLIDSTNTNLPELVVASHSTCSGDIDNDGDLDIFVGGLGDPRMLLNQGEANFIEDNTVLPNQLISASWIDEHRNETGVVADMMPSFSWCEMSDYDNDGYIDLLLGSNNNAETKLGNGLLIGNSHLLLFNNGNKTFEFTDRSLLTSAEKVTIDIKNIDLNSDGCSDFATLNSDYNHEQTIRIYENDCTGSFEVAFEEKQTNEEHLYFVNAISIQDIDQNNYVDLFTYYKSVIVSTQVDSINNMPAKSYFNFGNQIEVQNITVETALKLGPAAYIAFSSFK
ncbi:FG-GAP-like repeat-containing protein [Thalassotalea ganghwensis]